MQVTFGEEGSGFSKAEPLFLAPVGNMGEAWPPLMLPLVRSLRLREVEREVGGSRTRPGLRMDLEESFMEEEERREVKQMKSSLLLLLLVVVVVRVLLGLSDDDNKSMDIRWGWGCSVDRFRHDDDDDDEFVVLLKELGETGVLVCMVG